VGTVERGPRRCGWGLADRGVGVAHISLVPRRWLSNGSAPALTRRMPIPIDSDLAAGGVVRVRAAAFATAVIAGGVPGGLPVRLWQRCCHCRRSVAIVIGVGADEKSGRPSSVNPGPGAAAKRSESRRRAARRSKARPNNGS